MNYGSLLRPAAMVVAAAFVVGCSVDTPTSAVRIPVVPDLGFFDGDSDYPNNPGNPVFLGGTPQLAEVEKAEVCKTYVMSSGADAPATTTFNFTSVADAAKNRSFTIASPASGAIACREIWLDGNTGGNVTVTEPAIDGFITTVKRVEVINEVGPPTPNPVYTTYEDGVEQNFLTGRVGGFNTPLRPTGQLFLFTNTEEVNTGGCSLTQGYWKTHSSYGPAPSDAGWNLVPANMANPALGPNTIFFQSGKTWYQLFWTPPAGGNAYIQLAHQYMAAKLNVLNGASAPSAVTSAISAAETFFATAGNTPSKSYTNAQKQALRALASTLGSYNEGDIGPGHCGDTATS